MNPTEVSTTALNSSRPAIRIDGQVSPELEAALVSLEVDEAVNHVACCRAVFLNWGEASDGGAGYQFFDRQLLDFDRHLEILQDSQTLFSGRIVALDGLYSGNAPQIGVVAQDRLGGLQGLRRSRRFGDASEADAIRAIAGDYGLQTDIQSAALSHLQPEVIQLDQSDFDFLAQRCRRVGAEFWVDGSLLYVYERPARIGESLNLELGRELESFEVRANLANQVTAMRVSGWDMRDNRVIVATAEPSSLSGEVYGRIGGDFVAAIHGDREQQVAREGPLDDEQARSFAGAAMAATARRFVTGTGVARTEPRLRVGMTLSLSGLGELFDGDYYTTRVQHRHSPATGFETHFSVERADLQVSSLDSPKRPPPGQRPSPKNPPDGCSPDDSAKRQRRTIRDIR